MHYDAAFEYRKARENLIKLYRLELAAWDAALPETQIRNYGTHHGLMFSGHFLGIVDLLSADGEAYVEFRSVPVRPARREAYGRRPDGQIEYAGYLLSAVAWKAMQDDGFDAAYHRNRRRRP